MATKQNKRREMTVEEYDRMTNRPYRNKSNFVDYPAEFLTRFRRESGFTYTGEGASDKAGAGRGGQGGPTAKELANKDNPSWVEDAKQAAQDVEDQSKLDKAYERSRTTPYAKGGSVSSASARADGIAQRGKTRGTMVACGGGYMKGKK